MALSLRRRTSRFAASRRGLGLVTQGAQVSPNVLPTPESSPAPSASANGQVPSLAQPFVAQEKSTLVQGSGGTPPQTGWKYVGTYQNPGGDPAEIWLDPATGLNHMMAGGVDVVPPYAGNMGNAGTTAPVQAPPGPGLPGYVEPGANAAAPATGNGVTRVTQPASNPDAGTNRNFGGSPTVADKAMIGGVEVWAGGPYSGMPVASTPANAGDLTPYLKDPKAADPTGRIALTPVPPQ